MSDQQRPLPHVGITEQGLKELEIWLAKQLKWTPWVYFGTYPTDLDTTPRSPAFQNGWSNAGGGGQRLRFRRTVPMKGEKTQSLEIEGQVVGGDPGTIVGVLPNGFAPKETALALGAAGNSDVSIWRLYPNGNLVYVGVANSSGGGGGVTSIAKTGDTALTGDVTLTGGTNVTLTQSGQDISIAASGGGSGGYIGFVILQDQKTAGTAGGGSTSGAFNTRTLNTEVLDTNNDCSLSSNQFTLAAGTYDIVARVPGFITDRMKARLRNVTDSTTVLVGTSEYDDPSTGNTQNFSEIRGRFTIAASKALEIQQRVGNTRGTNGLGVESNYGEIEIYTTVSLWRIS